MFQTDQSTAASSLPPPAAAATQGFFTGGNPGSGLAATVLDADFLNMVMLELINVVEAAGLTPSKTTYTQVLSAIKRINQNTVVLADTGTANAYSAANAVPLVAGTWVDGVVQSVKIAHANTGASTYAPDGLSAIPIYGLGLQPLQGTELALNGTAILMHATIAGVNSGNPICVLMECAGGAQQVPPATAPQHAVQASQLFGGLKGISEFTSSGSMVVPELVTSVYLSGCAGGGGGGGCATVGSPNIISGGGGGACGQSAIRTKVTCVPGETLTVTVGAAGIGGALNTVGGHGGTTSIVGSISGTLLTLTGGGGGALGLAGSFSSYLAGQSGGAGFPNGGSGQDTGPVGVGASGGTGASGQFGGGGPGGKGSLIGNTMTQGLPAFNFGAGGGGCGGVYPAGNSTIPTSTGNVGAAGSPGFAIIEW